MISSGQHWTPELRSQVELELKTSGDSPTEVARRLKVNRGTVYKVARELGAEQRNERIELPDFDELEEDEPVEEIIDRMSRNFTRAKAARDKKRWFRVGVKESKPIGILAFGDPHLDDNGCNWPVLKRHAELCRTTDGLYGINIGDTTNCWGGRLVRLYANQDTSVKTARRLASWFMLESGIQWILWLLGNHETMGDGGPVLEEMNRRYGTQAMPLLDWAADFVLAFPNGVEIKVSCAHNFPGNSMWNPNHGAVKAARFGDGIDVLIHGHLHNWAISHWELAEQGSAPLMVRVRGYKHHDDHAVHIGAHEQEEGQAILIIFDPNAKSRAGRVQAFVDIERGVEVLNYLRSN